MLNNREWAILFWLALFSVWALSHREVRSSLFGAVQTFAHPKVLFPVVLMILWVVLEVWLGSQLNLWEPDLLSETVIWFVASGLVLFFNFEAASRQLDFFQRKLLALLTPVVLMEVLLDAFVLSLPAEITLQLVLAVLVMLTAVAGTEERLQRVQNLTGGLLVLMILALISQAAVNMAAHWQELDKEGLLLEAILPAWLTIGLLPLIYAVALLASYEVAFLRIDRHSGSARKRLLENKLALLASLNVNAHEVASFAGPWPHRIAEASSFIQARRIVADFRRARRETANSPP